MASYFRFLSGDRGIYEAVEKWCPRDDKRRQLKPDGAWLPKVGEKYPGAISFWTEKGVETYLSSGLQEWHRSVVREPLAVLKLDDPNEVYYQDEFQIICSSHQQSTDLEWEQFCESLTSIPIVDKVVAYVLRNNKRDLVVFEHDKEWSEAGIQVPAGTVDAGEDPKVAVLREVSEEVGLSNVKVIEKIDQYLMYRNTHSQLNRRHVYLLEAGEAIPEKWVHKVGGDGLDKGMNFHCYWLPLEEAEYRLAGSMGSSIRKVV